MQQTIIYPVLFWRSLDVADGDHRLSRLATCLSRGKFVRFCVFIRVVSSLGYLTCVLGPINLISWKESFATFLYPIYPIVQLLFFCYLLYNIAFVYISFLIHRCQTKFKCTVVAYYRRGTDQFVPLYSLDQLIIVIESKR